MMVLEKWTFQKSRYLPQLIERLTLNPNVNWERHKGRCSFLSLYDGGLLSLIPLPLETLYSEIYFSHGSKHKKTTFHYHQSGVNFINILLSPFVFENNLQSFSLITVWLCNFLSKEYCRKTARIMLMKLTIWQMAKSDNSLIIDWFERDDQREFFLDASIFWMLFNPTYKMVMLFLTITYSVSISYYRITTYWFCYSQIRL